MQIFWGKNHSAIKNLAVLNKCYSVITNETIARQSFCGSLEITTVYKYYSVIIVVRILQGHQWVTTAR
jgi:hypothetical protein